MGRTIPLDVVVLGLIVWLGFKGVRWWTRARNLEESNALLRAENEQLKSDIALLADDRKGGPNSLR
jgi:hypothetical protein